MTVVENCDTCGRPKIKHDDHGETFESCSSFCLRLGFKRRQAGVEVSYEAPEAIRTRAPSKNEAARRSLGLSLVQGGKAG